MILGIIAQVDNNSQWMVYSNTLDSKDISANNVNGWSSYTSLPDVSVMTSVLAVEFSANNQWLAVGGASTGDKLRVFNTSDWSEVTISTQPSTQVQIIKWSPDNTRLVVGTSGTPYIHIYNTSDWSKLSNPTTLPSTGLVSIAINPASTRCVVGPGISRVYDMSDWSSVANSLSGGIYGADFSLDGSKLVVSLGTVTPRVREYETGTWTQVSTPASDVAGVPSTKDSVVHLGTHCVFSHATTPYVTVYETSGWTKVTTGTSGGEPSQQINSISKSKDGSLLVGITTSAIVVWRTSDWQVVHTITSGVSGGNTIAFSS